MNSSLEEPVHTNSLFGGGPSAAAATSESESQFRQIPTPVNREDVIFLRSNKDRTSPPNMGEDEVNFFNPCNIIYR